MMFGKSSILIFMLTAYGCANSNFTGGGAGKPGSATTPEKEPSTGTDPETDDNEAGDGKKPEPAANDTDESAKGPPVDDQPSDLVEKDGEVVAPINYETCKSLPASGKRGYGKCNADEVVVIINDGKAQEMTCCPVSGKRVFSAVASELFVERTGLCQANEVLTGMVEPKGPTIVCSKINTKYLELGPSIPSQYVANGAAGVLGQIAASYNNSDTCICPEGTSAIGGHTASDNRCAEQCVVIKKKP